MKLNHGLGKKWKHGSASVAITAAVIAVVILVNLLVGALCSENLWFLDLTPYKVSATTGELRSFQMYKLDSTSSRVLTQLHDLRPEVHTWSLGLYRHSDHNHTGLAAPFDCP